MATVDASSQTPPAEPNTAERRATEPQRSIPRRQAVVGGLAAVAAAASGLSIAEYARAAGPEKGGLTLKDAQMPAKLNKLFADLKDKKLQQEFIENPVSVLNQRALGQKKLSAQRISNANRALYALVSNPGFVKWAEGYEAETAKKGTVSKNKVLADLAQAMAKHADPVFLTAMLEDHAARAEETDTTASGSAILVTHLTMLLDLSIVVACVILTEDCAGITLGTKDMRSIMEQMTAHATKLRTAGKLSGKVIDLK